MFSWIVSGLCLLLLSVERVNILTWTQRSHVLYQTALNIKAAVTYEKIAFRNHEENCFVQVTTSVLRSSISIRNFGINSWLLCPVYCSCLRHVSFIFHFFLGVCKVWITLHTEEGILGWVAGDSLYFACTGPWMRALWFPVLVFKNKICEFPKGTLCWDPTFILPLSQVNISRFRIFAGSPQE